MNDKLAIDTLRFLAADMVQKANSGHPGMPMGAAPMAWTLWSRHLKQDPSDPHWADRDRFVLSAGHGSALIYGLLHIFNYGLPTEELENFRQLGSRTPGHPEYGHTVGVEATTGPLGQGIAMGVGMALAERMQNARYPDLIDHHTYVIAGDGCLMEGVSHEAASFAGHQKLGNLILFWDDNSITIDGSTHRSTSDDQIERFTGYGWHTQGPIEGTDIDAIDAAITAAKADPRPSFIAVRTVIGQGAPGIEGTAKAHGSPLGAEVLAETKRLEGWTYDPFVVPDEVQSDCAALGKAGAEAHAAWQEKFEAFQSSNPEAAAEFLRTENHELPDGFAEALDGVVGEAPRATRQSSQACLKALLPVMPELVGGSADLAGSTGTAHGELVESDNYGGTEIAFGIREFGMAGIVNGMFLHGGFRPFGSTFLVFSDYLRPALRLAALMKIPVIHVLTHDSIAVGEDGPTHEPVEHVESLRLIPNLQVLRPADDAETVQAWRMALERTDGPTALILTRQNLPQLDPSTFDSADAKLEIVATGSEVSTALGAAEILRAEGVSTRVVSVLDRRDYEPSDGVTTVSVEAGATGGWHGTVDLAIGIDHFGDSGKGDEVMAHHGFTPEKVAERIREFLAR
ncbi:MAG: transketolase [Aeromicrobium sp.]